MRFSWRFCLSASKHVRQLLCCGIKKRLLGCLSAAKHVRQPLRGWCDFLGDFVYPRLSMCDSR
ncbi:hypothetical protein ACFPN4_00395 [Ureibacillus thermophilus]|uniref:hypothetical protein n=1 Tax=Ureibacillus thermophilus TaxID=367743 RepID=UPI003615BFD9